MADARAAVLTPPGSAAVATVAVVGTDAWSILRSLFRRSGNQSLPIDPDECRHWTGEFGGPPGDTAVVSVRRIEPMPWIEIHSHGGQRVVQWLLDELQRAGCKLSSVRALLEETGLSPLQAEAAVALSQSTTVRTAGILLDQYRGALNSAISATIDDVQRNDMASANRRIAEVLRYSNIGRRLQSGWRVAICGAPNVGKSSLVNRLLGYSRCIVTPIPGTTRDAVTSQIAIDGWPVQMIDTAGLRTTADALESSGIDRARSEMASADLVVWLVDVSALHPKYPPDSQTPLVIANKIDLVKQPIADVDASISARTGQGVDELLVLMAQRLAPVIPPPGSPVPFSSDLTDRLTEIANQLRHGEVNPAVAALRDLLGARPS